MRRSTSWPSRWWITTCFGGRWRRYWRRGGDWGPQHHETLVREIADQWPDVLERLPLTPKDVFFHLTEMVGGPNRFITVACLTHLMFPNWVPIIDQHNFRAMNWLMKLVRPEWRSLKAPTMWEDIMWLGQFMTEVPNAWPPGHEAPSRLVIDRYLMMYGRTLKSRKGLKVTHDF